MSEKFKSWVFACLFAGMALVAVMWPLYVGVSSKQSSVPMLYGDTIKYQRHFYAGMQIIPYRDGYAAKPCEWAASDIIATSDTLAFIINKDTLLFDIDGVNPTDHTELICINKKGVPIIFQHTYLRDTTEEFMLIKGPQPPYILLNADSACFTLPDKMAEKTDKLSANP